MNFIGKTIHIRYNSGLEVRAHYESASQMRWEALSGPAKGTAGTETISAAEVAADVYFISWLESSGTTVSNVIDFNLRSVYAYVTYQAGSARQAYFDRGTMVSVTE